MKHLFYLLPLITLAACTSKTEAQRQQAERDGAAILDEARLSFRQSRYDEARQHIRRLRSDVPLALDARRQAIILLDSIELRAATDSVQYAEGEQWERLDMKQKFYQRKLSEDIKAYGGKNLEY